MTTLQEGLLTELEGRLDVGRAFSERLARELLPGYPGGRELTNIEVDHLILYMSDLDLRRRMIPLMP